MKKVLFTKSFKIFNMHIDDNQNPFSLVADFEGDGGHITDFAVAQHGVIPRCGDACGSGTEVFSSFGESRR